MPIATSSVINQIRDTNYTKTRVPFFPDNKWKHGNISFYLKDYEIFINGIFQGWNVSYLSFQSAGVDSTYGKYVRQQTTGTDNNYRTHEIGRYDDFLVNIPTKILLQFRLNQSTNLRYWFGFFTGTADNLAGTDDDDSLGVNECDGFGLRVGLNGNFKIYSNNASQASNISADIATVDTNFHKIYLEFDPINSRCGYSFDNANITWVTSQIPTTATRMRLGWHIRADEAAIKSWDLFNLEGEEKETF